MDRKDVYKKILKIQELLIIAIVLIVSFSYLNNEKLIIKADGKGYYEYLPATFIYNDLSWSFLDTLNTPGYYKHSEYIVGAIVGPPGDLHNKYFIGTAILMTPFFAIAHCIAIIGDYPADGYSYPYQQTMWYSALFYLWIGLFFLRKILLKLKIRRFIIFMS